MNHNFILFFIGIAPAIAFAQPQPIHQFTIPSDSIQVYVTDIVVDQSGTIFIGASRKLAHEPDEKQYIAAYSPNGTRLWDFTLGEKFGNPSFFLSQWGHDHLVAINHPEDSTGTFNIQVLKLTKTGELVWSYYYGKNNALMEIPTDYTIDKDLNLIISAGEHQVESKQLLLKLTPDGTPVFTNIRPFPEVISQSYFVETTTDSLNNIIAYSRNLFRTTDLVSVVKFSPTGEFIWEKSFDFWPTGEIRHTQLITLGTDILLVGAGYKSGVGPTSTLNIVRLDENGDSLFHKTISLSEQGSIQEILAVSACGPNRFLIIPLTFLSGDYTTPKILIDQKGNLISKWIPDPVRDVVKAKVLPSPDSVLSAFIFRSFIQQTDFNWSDPQNIQISQRPVIPVGNSLSDLFFADDLVWGFISWPQEPAQVLAYDHSTLTTVETNPISPSTFQIRSVYPNPFNPSTRVEINLADAGTVHWCLTDLTGRHIQASAIGNLTPGLHTLHIDGSRLASGVYFLQIRQRTSVQTAKLVLIR